ncbi:hypothetical protein EDB92DRAFT_1814194 [Lactarius akahatsu]|uniref:Uncharacterized protein n=1 Tax=Lactarius akahatsu TaxID=416441 RepID=A0AAD4LN93_9AGAM|nr:hypothetical protein EDB92DRAFT_1814194 [Lactarius akahatsu]
MFSLNRASSLRRLIEIPTCLAHLRLREGSYELVIFLHRGAIERQLYLVAVTPYSKSDTAVREVAPHPEFPVSEGNLEQNAIATMATTKTDVTEIAGQAAGGRWEGMSTRQPFIAQRQLHNTDIETTTHKILPLCQEVKEIHSHVVMNISTTAWTVVSLDSCISATVDAYAKHCADEAWGAGVEGGWGVFTHYYQGYFQVTIPETPTAISPVWVVSLIRFDYGSGGDMPILSVSTIKQSNDTKDYG